MCVKTANEIQYIMPENTTLETQNGPFGKVRQEGTDRQSNRQESTVVPFDFGSCFCSGAKPNTCSCVSILLTQRKIRSQNVHEHSDF